MSEPELTRAQPLGDGRFAVPLARPLSEGERLLVDCGGRSVGVFKLAGELRALHNRCPHQGAPLALGTLTPRMLATDQFGYRVSEEAPVLRCPWHGWEFDLVTGQSLGDGRMRCRIYAVCVGATGLVIDLRHRQQCPG